jgi:hypothetical protein
VHSSCLIPRFDGAILSLEWKDRTIKPWDHTPRRATAAAKPLQENAWSQSSTAKRTRGCEICDTQGSRFGGAQGRLIDLYNSCIRVVPDDLTIKNIVSRPTSRRQACVSGQASELSADHVLQHFPVERQLRDDLLQPRILVRESLQPPHLVRQQPAVSLLPVEVSRLADPRLAADLGNRSAFLALLQDERLLRFRELRCLHHLQLLSQPGKASRKLQI